MDKRRENDSVIAEAWRDIFSMLSLSRSLDVSGKNRIENHTEQRKLHPPLI